MCWVDAPTHTSIHTHTTIASTHATRLGEIPQQGGQRNQAQKVEDEGRAGPPSQVRCWLILWCNGMLVIDGMVVIWRIGRMVGSGDGPYKHTNPHAPDSPPKGSVSSRTFSTEPNTTCFTARHTSPTVSFCPSPSPPPPSSFPFAAAPAWADDGGNAVVGAFPSSAAASPTASTAPYLEAAVDDGRDGWWWDEAVAPPLRAAASWEAMKPSSVLWRPESVARSVGPCGPSSD